MNLKFMQCDCNITVLCSLSFQSKKERSRNIMSNISSLICDVIFWQCVENESSINSLQSSTFDLLYQEMEVQRSGDLSSRNLEFWARIGTALPAHMLQLRSWFPNSRKRLNCFCKKVAKEIKMEQVTNGTLQNLFQSVFLSVTNICWVDTC